MNLFVYLFVESSILLFFVVEKVDMKVKFNLRYLLAKQTENQRLFIVFAIKIKFKTSSSRHRKSSDISYKQKYNLGNTQKVKHNLF